jgi:hypothetical protein
MLRAQGNTPRDKDGWPLLVFRPLLERSVAGEAFFGKERSDMGFERVGVLGNRALAHGNGGRNQNGRQYQQVQE